MNDLPQSGFPAADLFTRLWSEFAGKMMSSGMAFSPGNAAPEVSRDMRTAMFRAWSDYCDQYMRSPEFLEMMKQSLGASLEARKQLNDFLGRVQHEFQGASRQDVDQMMSTLQHLEQRIVDRLDDMSAEFAQLQQRMQAIEKMTSKKSGKKKSHSEDDD